MVSKVAVIALVAIVAIPILLGYAFNIQETNVTEYKTTGDSVNVTQLLKTDTEYTLAAADIYTLNTNFTISTGAKILPAYTLTDTTSSYPLKSKVYPVGSHASEGGALSNYEYYYFMSYNEGSGGTITVTLKTPGNVVYQTINNLKTFYYSYAEKTFSYCYTNSYLTNTISLPDGYTITITDTGGYTGTCFIEWKNNYVDPAVKYVDFSAGYTFDTYPYLGKYTGVKLELPDYSNAILFTVDLSSITSSSYSFSIHNVKFVKTTDIEGVHWKVQEMNMADPFDEFELYYDQDSSNNTYQFKMTADPTKGYSVGSAITAYPLKYEFKYVGQWPDTFGEANYYQSYQAESIILKPGPGDLNISSVIINTVSQTSPVMRVDGAVYRAFEHPVIGNKTYDPAAFKTNPKTTISDIYQYGSTITFGGITYNVKGGNITLGTHQIPVEGITFSSTPNAGGGYDNKIGNTIISTTVDPSTIQFEGKWSATVITDSQESYNYSETKWIAGSFAWNGIDHNFLLCGMVACIAAFVGCGIYAKKSGSGGIIPVMIVCGGAALMFFLML